MRLRETRLEVVPRIPDVELEALRRALAESVSRVDGQPEQRAGAWCRAAACEAVENEPERPVYVLSPRSTRGATRA